MLINDNQILTLIPKQSRSVNKLIRQECCNYDNGNCILLDDGEVCVCPQTITYSHIICKWFKNAVLPIDKDLHTEITKPKNLKRCANCGKNFSSNANKTKYCDNCRIIVRRKKKAEYERNRRLRVDK